MLGSMLKQLGILLLVFNFLIRQDAFIKLLMNKYKINIKCQMSYFFFI